METRKVQHTLGERTVRRFDESQFVVLSGTNLVGTFTGPDRAGNAHLDKAAPALLDACRAAREVMTAVYSLRSDGPGRQAYDKLRAAIAQAVPPDISEDE